MPQPFRGGAAGYRIVSVALAATAWLLVSCAGSSPVPAAASGASARSAGGERAAPRPVASLETPVPSDWMSALRRCGRKGRRSFCDGPRRVPVPSGPAARLARELGLGTADTARILLNEGAAPRWVDSAGGRARDTLLWPVRDARIGRGLGRPRLDGRTRYHNGVDMPAPGGSLIRSVNDGIVAYADNGVPGFGNVLMIVHPDATIGVYAHMRAIYVHAGQHVARGQTVGEVGTTGISQGNHLHFELRRGGVVEDPVGRFVDFPLDEEGLPLFARPRPRRHAAAFRGFENLR